MEKFFYRVQRGETVLSLSHRYKVPPTVIIQGNNLTGEISEGDILFLQKSSGEVYTVQPFDTVESVAARFKVTAKSIKNANGVDYLFYGLKILIPR